MQTIKVISNISYNTPSFFASVIDRLIKQGVIDWCYWIVHEPDKDENKRHIHFVLKPSKRLDTAILRKEFLEADKDCDKPLCCLTKWQFTSSMEDWLLYSIHDKSYLASKNQTRNLHYSFNDLRATDYDALRVDWNAIDWLKFNRLHLLEDALENHIPFALLVQDGQIPIAQRAQWEKQYNALRYLRNDPRYNGGRKVPHEQKIEQLDIEGNFTPIDDIDF